MHDNADDSRHISGPPGSEGSRTSLVWLACGAGLAAASSLVLLTGLSDLGMLLGLPPWSARLLSGAAGLVGAATVWRAALRRSSPAGLTPAQAFSQLRRDLDLASAAAPNPRGTGTSRDAGALG